LEGFSYFPVDLQNEGVKLNPDDPYHLGHYGNEQIDTILYSCGFEKKRELIYRHSAAGNVTETFSEYQKANNQEAKR
jgi:methionine salvage enolase-phosphatase E1